MSFKLLSIRPFEGCSRRVLNNLIPNEFYFFDNAYEQYDNEDNGVSIRKKKGYNDLNSNFYYTRNKELGTVLETINIQAIVGKNGSGKSSIIEFLLRLLNNFFKQYKIGLNTDNLIYSKDLVGELFFLNNEIIYKIKVDSRELNKKTINYAIYEYIEIELYKDFKKVFDTNDLIVDESYRSELMPLETLFYSMYINYSLYGLDEENYLDESCFTLIQKEDIKNNLLSDRSSWISSILHKNDGYQTPLLIHPYREESMIDVRKEKMLMNQRLASLIFTDESFRSILPNYYFTHIILKAKENKLSSLVKYVNNSKNDINNSKKGIKHSPQNEVFKIIENMLLQGVLNGKIDELYNYLKLNKIFFKTLKKEYEKIENKDIENKDIENYLLYTYYLIYTKLPENKNIIVEFEDFKKKYGKDCQNFNYIIKKTYKPSNDIYNKNTTDTSKLIFIYDYIGYLSYDELMEYIFVASSTRHWSRILDIDSTETFESKIGINKLRQSLFWYVVTKTCRLKKYKRFNFVEPLLNIYYQMQQTANQRDFFNKEQNDFFKRLENDNSHITLKIKQCETLLKLFLKDSSKNLEKIYLEIFNEKDINEELLKIEYLGGIVENEAIINKTELIKLLPPSVFEYIFLSSKGNNKKESVNVDKLSSGQFQKIGLLSSIVYHLKNLDSIPKNINTTEINKKSYCYENVLIILDEIELYFHPEQQRTFVKDFIDLLEKSSFKKIKNISLIFITHSPFILSDIPTQNVLKLENGKTKEGNEVNSFGANIHDLLADEFFLENGFMGEFAKSEINKVVDYLNYIILSKQKEQLQNNSEKEVDDSKKRSLNQKFKNMKKRFENNDKYHYNYCKSFINQIGEPMIKMSMIELLNQAFNEGSISYIKQQIEKLKSMIPDDSNTH